MKTELRILELKNANDLEQLKNLVLSVAVVAGYDIPSQLRFAAAVAEAGQMAMATQVQLVFSLTEDSGASLEIKQRQVSAHTAPGDAAGVATSGTHDLLIADLPLPDSFCLQKIKALFASDNDQSLSAAAQFHVAQTPTELQALLNQQKAEIAALKNNQRAGAAQLPESENLFRAMADGAPVMIWISGTHQHCDFVNKAWLDFTGRLPDAETGEGWMDSIHPDDLPDCRKLYDETFAQQQAFTIEYRLRRHDGEYRWVMDSGAPRYTRDGEFYGFVGSCIDIHERRTQADAMEKRVSERTAELREANKELHRSNGELEQFAYVASHDLQEPLRKISVFSERLRQLPAGKLPPEAKEYLVRMNNAAQRMQRLVEDLLSFSKVSRGSRQFYITDLNQVLQEVLSDISLQVELTKATISADSLPSILAEPVYIRQLFQNLLANALKFQQSGVRPEISITAQARLGEQVKGLKPSKEYVELVFRDNGIGFDDTHADTIFAIFHRLHGRSEYPGTGIGLAICKKIIESHQGQIRASGKPGEGSTFTVWLPVR